MKFETARTELIQLIKERATVVEDGVVCHSGETATVYLDIPKVLGDSEALRLGSEALWAHVMDTVPHYHRINAVGGPTTGSIPLVVGLAAEATDLKWFIVRDHAKDHGLGRILVGAEIGEADTVIVTDDVVSGGDSMVETVDKVLATGATIAAIIPLVHRGGDEARMKVEAFGIPYLPVLTHDDLGLPPLGTK